MTIDAVSEMTNNALYVIIKVSLPVLLVSLVVGLVISIFQTVTSIQEQTLTEDRCHLFVSGGYRSLDDEHDGGVHGAIVVKFQPVCT